MMGTRDGDATTRRDAAERPSPGERWKLLLGWLVVGIPAAWGVAQVVVKSMALFR
jgi:hypothetical protein